MLSNSADFFKNLREAVNAHNENLFKECLTTPIFLKFPNLCMDGEPLLITAIKHNLLRSIPNLINAGADPNVINAHGQTPLHLAAYTGNTALVDLLLKFGSDPTIADFSGLTPLFYAIYSNAATIVAKFLSIGPIPANITECIVSPLKPHVYLTRVNIHDSATTSTSASSSAASTPASKPVRRSARHQPVLPPPEFIWVASVGISVGGQCVRVPLKQAVDAAPTNALLSLPPELRPVSSDASTAPHLPASVPPPCLGGNPSVPPPMLVSVHTIAGTRVVLFAGGLRAGALRPREKEGKAGEALTIIGTGISTGTGMSGGMGMAAPDSPFIYAHPAIINARDAVHATNDTMLSTNVNTSTTIPVLATHTGTPMTANCRMGMGGQTDEITTTSTTFTTSAATTPSLSSHSVAPSPLLLTRSRLRTPAPHADAATVSVTPRDTCDVDAVDNAHGMRGSAREKTRQSSKGRIGGEMSDEAHAPRGGVRGGVDDGDATEEEEFGEKTKTHTKASTRMSTKVGTGGLEGDRVAAGNTATTTNTKTNAATDSSKEGKLGNQSKSRKGAQSGGKPMNDTKGGQASMDAKEVVGGDDGTAVLTTANTRGRTHVRSSHPSSTSNARPRSSSGLPSAPPSPSLLGPASPVRPRPQLGPGTPTRYLSELYSSDTHADGRESTAITGSGTVTGVGAVSPLPLPLSMTSLAALPTLPLGIAAHAGTHANMGNSTHANTMSTSHMSVVSPFLAPPASPLLRVLARTLPSATQSVAHAEDNATTGTGVGIEQGFSYSYATTSRPSSHSTAQTHTSAHARPQSQSQSRSRPSSLSRTQSQSRSSAPTSTPSTSTSTSASTSASAAALATSLLSPATTTTTSTSTPTVPTSPAPASQVINTLASLDHMPTLVDASLWALLAGNRYVTRMLLERLPATDVIGYFAEHDNVLAARDYVLALRHRASSRTHTRPRPTSASTTNATALANTSTNPSAAPASSSHLPASPADSTSTSTSTSTAATAAAAASPSRIITTAVTMSPSPGKRTLSSLPSSLATSMSSSVSSSLSSRATHVNTPAATSASSSMPASSTPATTPPATPMSDDDTANTNATTTDMNNIPPARQLAPAATEGKERELEGEGEADGTVHEPARKRARTTRGQQASASASTSTSAATHLCTDMATAPDAVPMCTGATMTADKEVVDVAREGGRHARRTPARSLHNTRTDTNTNTGTTSNAPTYPRPSTSSTSVATSTLAPASAAASTPAPSSGGAADVRSPTCSSTTRNTHHTRTKHDSTTTSPTAAVTTGLAATSTSGSPSRPSVQARSQPSTPMHTHTQDTSSAPTSSPQPPDSVPAPLSPEALATLEGRALMAAVFANAIESVRALLALGVSPTYTQPDNGWSLLHVAALQGHAQLVTLLLEHGAYPRARNSAGDTPLALAQRYRKVQVVAAFEQFAQRRHQGRHQREHSPFLRGTDVM